VSGLTGGPCLSRDNTVRREHRFDPNRNLVYLILNKFVTTHPLPCLVLLAVVRCRQSRRTASLFYHLFASLSSSLGFPLVSPIPWPVVSRLNRSASGRRPAAYSLSTLVLLLASPPVGRLLFPPVLRHRDHSPPGSPRVLSCPVSRPPVVSKSASIYFCPCFPSALSFFLFCYARRVLGYE
jgi:hypothetical protein